MPSLSRPGQIHGGFGDAKLGITVTVFRVSKLGIRDTVIFNQEFIWQYCYVYVYLCLFITLVKNGFV